MVVWRSKAVPHAMWRGGGRATRGDGVSPPPWQEGGAICDKGSCGGGGSPFGTRGCVWLESHKIGTALFQFF
jgi:hypothetical protein